MSDPSVIIAALNQINSTVNQILATLQTGASKSLPTPRPAPRPWTEPEFQTVLTTLQAGGQFADVCKQAQRSEASVRRRLGQFLGWRTRQGDTQETLAKLINGSVEDVAHLIGYADKQGQTQRRAVPRRNVVPTDVSKVNVSNATMEV